MTPWCKHNIYLKLKNNNMNNIFNDISHDYNEFKEGKGYECRSFHLSDEPEVLHIIRSGEPGYYLVIGEDAYESVSDKIQKLTEKEIYLHYGIKL